MRELPREKAQQLARAKLTEQEKKGLAIDQADGLVLRSMGRVIVAPASPAVPKGKLKGGAVVAGIHIQHAPPGAWLKDGFYSLKVMDSDGVWVAQLLRGDEVVASTANVRVVSTDYDGTKPEVVLVEGTIAIFLLGVCVGLAIGLYIATH